MSECLSDIQEVNLDNINVENVNEQAYLELADQFKEINTKKSQLIKDLKKAIMVLYSLIKVADENTDPEMICQARQVASEYIDEFFFEDD